jgi:hypothetical protein
MRLVSEKRTAIIKPLFPFVQYPSPFSGGGYDWGVTSGYAISRDGSRIAAQNGRCVIVCDSSGDHKKVISTTKSNLDCISLSFDDSTTDGKTIHRVVYAAIPWLILRTTLSDTNTAMKTDTLWTRSESDPCYISRATYTGYTSVNKNGRYLSFNIIDNAGVCIPVVADLVSKQSQLPLGNCSIDGCQIRSCWDAKGTVSFHIWSHRIPTTLWRWDTPGNQNVGTVPCPVDPANCGQNAGDPGQGGYYWCETDTNFMIQVGDNDVNSSPGCYSKAYLRKGKTTNPPQVMYLGDYLGWPAMWIDPAEYTTRTINGRIPLSNPTMKVALQIRKGLLTLTNANGNAIENAMLINSKGMTVVRGTMKSADTYHFLIGHLPRGIYILCWLESNMLRAQAVTINR